MSLFKKIVRFIKSIVTRERVEDLTEMALQFGSNALIALLKNKLGPKVAVKIEELWPQEMDGLVKKSIVIDFITDDILSFLTDQAIPATVKAARELADSLVQDVYIENKKTDAAATVQAFVAKEAAV